MEGEQGIDLIPRGGEIVIPMLLSAQGSDNGMQGGNSKNSTTSESGSYSLSNTVQDKASNNGKSTNSKNLRRRHSSKITESDSTLTELQFRNLSGKFRFSRTKSRVLELEESNPTSSILFSQGSELRATRSFDKSSLSKKIKSMRAGSLPPAEENGDEDDDKSDDTDDDAEEVEEKMGDQKNPNHIILIKKFKKLRDISVLIEWILFICALIVLVASLYVHNLKTRIIWGLEIWKLCVLVAVIFCGRLVTRWAKNSIVLLIESKFLFNEKVVYFLHGVKQSVRVVIWLSLVLLAWTLLIDHRDAKRSRETTEILNYITKTLASALIGAVIWMAKTLLIKLIAASFHVKTFFAKIREAISDEYVLWTLSMPPSLKLEENGGNPPLSSPICCFKPPKWRSHKGKKEESEVENQQKVIHKKSKDVQIKLKKLGKMKPGKMPASTMGQLIDRIRSSKLSIVSSALDDSHDDGGEQKDITSRLEAEVAASLIFQNVKKPDRDCIEKGDLEDFMNEENWPCLVEWYQKVAKEEKIDKDALTDWTVNTFKEREYLSYSLKDAKTAIEELNRILSGVVLVLMLIVWLLMMGFATTKMLVFFSSQILVMGFMIGNACRTLFEAMIFVFVIHPFDIGDRCVIDGVQMIAEEMDIFKTAFLRYDNEMIYYPNAVLASKAISNFNRSPEQMCETVNFDVDLSTSSDSITTLKAKIKEYILNNSHYWHPLHSLQTKDIEDMNKMKMALYVEHKINFQDFLQKMNRRTELMLALKKIFEEVGIKYHPLPLEVHTNYIGSAVPTSTSVMQPRSVPLRARRPNILWNSI